MRIIRQLLLVEVLLAFPFRRERDPIKSKAIPKDRFEIDIFICMLYELILLRWCGTPTRNTTALKKAKSPKRQASINNGNLQQPRISTARSVHKNIYVDILIIYAISIIIESRFFEV